MAIRLDYVVKETGSNLVRNFTLTFAAILTVAVSLAMVAASYLIGTGISTSFMGLRSDVRLFVYMNPSATKEQIDSVQKSSTVLAPGQGGRLLRHGQKTYDEFKKPVQGPARPGQPGQGRRAPAELPDQADQHRCRRVSSLGDSYESKPGVQQVEYAAEYARQAQRSVNTLNNWVRSPASP